jgi:uncharacterized delta-60 repeat protein
MLDPTFGDGGVVYINADPTLNSYAQAVVVQPDGKVVLAGTISKTAERRFALIRLTVTGSLDTGFGDAGIVSTAFPSGKGGIATAVALTADGRILAGGNVYVDATSTDFAIARYSPGGTLDTTFGDGGVAFAGFGPPEGGGVTSIAVLPDGHVLAAGYRGLTAGAMSNDHAVAKFDVNGSRDATFGAGGRVKVDIRGTNDAPNAMLVQSDGRIVLAGSSGRPPMSFADLSVVRLQPDGSLDPSWGTAGKVVHVIGAQSSSAYAASVDGAGRMVLGGGIYGTIEDFLVVRLTSTGSLDSAFGSGGVVTTDFGGNSEFAARLYIQPDGKIVQVGRSSNGTPPVALGFARHQSDGSPDLGFGVGGKVLSVKPSGFDDYAAAFSRGRVTLVGLGSPGGVGGVPWLWMGAARFCL